MSSFESNFEVLLIIMGLAVVIVTLMRRLQLPPILGYLAAGAAVGPYGLALLESREEISHIAEFGVVFLLFSIGLELSLPKLISMRRALLGLGGLQVIICTAIAMAVSKFAGLSWPAAIAASGALTLSSTAVATKLLIEQDELHQTHGKLSLAILLFQDLAAVPFLIIVPALAGGDTDTLGNLLLQRILVGTVIFIGMLAAGRYLLRPLFHHIAEARSSELFMLTALLIVLASAFLTEHYGLSAALGAFLAGVMLAETEYVHQIESDIQPFRDILLGLFFITVGIIIDPRVLVADWQWIALIVMAIIVIKALVIAWLAKLAGTQPVPAIRTGLVLAQGGEFGLFLLAVAINQNVMQLHANQVLISSIVLSMAISPLLIRKSEKIARFLLKRTQKEKEDAVDDMEKIPEEQSNHVIICGYGRVGQTLARFLEYEGIPFIGMDVDPVRLREARTAAEPVFYGDPCEENVLISAGIEKARMLIIAFSHPKQALKILRNVRRLNKEIPVLVRTLDDSELESLTVAGATEVIPDKLESSLMLASHMLVLLGQPLEKAQQQVMEVKANRYKFLKGFFEGEKLGHLENTKEKWYLHAVVLPESAYAVSRSLEEITTEKGPIAISSFRRQGYKCDFPTPHLIFEAGDVIVLEGTKEEIYNMEERLLQG